MPTDLPLTTRFTLGAAITPEQRVKDRRVAARNGPGVDRIEPPIAS